MSELSKEQQTVWDRLQNGIDDPMFVDCSFSSMAARQIDVVFNIERLSGDKASVGMQTIKVLKSR